jgi:hypothetical protein
MPLVDPVTPEMMPCVPFVWMMLLMMMKLLDLSR